MSGDGGRALPRRPVPFGPLAMETHGGTLPGPAEVTEVAHQTAAILVGTGRAAHDPEVTTRLVTLVDDLGVTPEAVHRLAGLVAHADAQEADDRVVGR